MSKEEVDFVRERIENSPFFMVPKTEGQARLYLSYTRPGNLVAAALVDKDMLPLLEKMRPWYITVKNKRLDMPKKPVPGIDREGRPYQFNLQLNRVVFTLFLTPEDEREKLVTDLGQLWTLSQNLPRIDNLNGIKLDCTIENLSAAHSERSQTDRAKKGLTGLGVGPDPEPEHAMGPIFPTREELDQIRALKKPDLTNASCDPENPTSEEFDISMLAPPKKESYIETLKKILSEVDDTPVMESNNPRISGSVIFFPQRNVE